MSLFILQSRQIVLQNLHSLTACHATPLVASCAMISTRKSCSRLADVVRAKSVAAKKGVRKLAGAAKAGLKGGIGAGIKGGVGAVAKGGSMALQASSVTQAVANRAPKTTDTTLLL